MHTITSPVLLVDEGRCRANIHRMARRATAHNLIFKPHFKTHQSAEIGEWFREEGVQAITVSSISMATYFARHGWSDITIAFPVNIREMQRLNALAAHIQITVLLDNTVSLMVLDQNIKNRVNVFIEIDTGSGRSGLRVNQTDKIEELIQRIDKSEKLTFAGFYSHPGHSYACRSINEIRKIHTEVMDQLQTLRETYRSAFPDFSICAGDTPCCSVADHFEAVDQISPGNFVFYDLMQTQIGSCNTDDIAVALACPVVAKYPERNELVVHAGAVHLSKERLETDSGTHYGRPVALGKQGWQNVLESGYVRSLSQEHGIIAGMADNAFASTEIGNIIGILPVHSCLTADAMMSYRTLDGQKFSHFNQSIA